MRAILHAFKQSRLQTVLIVITLGIFIFQLSQIFYYQKDAFLTPYDSIYWTDRVEHSRYYLPLSQRGIGDGEFYAYGGYKILHGEDPTKLVYDKPALGIFLLGIFSAWLHNPAFSGLFFGLGSIVLTFLISFKLTKKIYLGLITATLLLLDPSISYHLSASLLDLPQLFFLLLNIYLLVLLKKDHKAAAIIIFSAGLALGIFAQIKIPVHYPIIFLFEIVLLFKYFGKTKALWFLLGNIIAFLLGYAIYFASGYSFFEFIKIQKFIIAFYRDSKIPLHPEAMWQFLFTGNFPDVVSGIPSKVAEWSFLYPIAVAAGIFYSVKILFTSKHQTVEKTFALFILFNLLLYTVIPSYPRYIILILPFLYFFMVKVLFDGKTFFLNTITFLLISIFSLVNTFLYFHESPASFVSLFYNNFSHQYAQDIYQEQLDSENKSKISRDEFENIAMRAFADAHIKNITVQESPYKYELFDMRVSVPVIITYKTEYLGEFAEQKNIVLVREHSKWKVLWDWNYLLNGFDTNATIESTRIIGKRGSIIDNKKNVLAQDTNGYLVSFNPSLMDSTQEKAILELLSNMSLLQVAAIQNAYLENALPKTYIPLFTTTSKLLEPQRNELLSFKGMRLEVYPSREYATIDPKSLVNIEYEECCTRIYSSYNYHGKSGPEKALDKQLTGYDGGTLLIREADGNIKRVIIQKNPKNGSDVILP